MMIEKKQKHILAPLGGTPQAIFPHFEYYAYGEIMPRFWIFLFYQNLLATKWQA